MSGTDRRASQAGRLLALEELLRTRCNELEDHTISLNRLAAELTMVAERCRSIVAMESRLTLAIITAEGNHWVGTERAAEYANESVANFVQGIRDGKYRAHQETPKSHYKIDLRELDEDLKKIPYAQRALEKVS